MANCTGCSAKQRFLPTDIVAEKKPVEVRFVGKEECPLIGVQFVSEWPVMYILYLIIYVGNTQRVFKRRLCNSLAISSCLSWPTLSARAVPLPASKEVVLLLFMGGMKVVARVAREAAGSCCERSLEGLLAP